MSKFFLEAKYNIGTPQVVELPYYHTCKMTMLNHCNKLITSIKNSNKFKSYTDRFYVYDIEHKFDGKYEDKFEYQGIVYWCSIYQWSIYVNNRGLFRYRIIISK